MKKCNNTIGNRTRDLPACSVVPQPTVPPRAPLSVEQYIIQRPDTTSLKKQATMSYKLITNVGRKGMRLWLISWTASLYRLEAKSYHIKPAVSIATCYVSLLRIAALGILCDLNQTFHLSPPGVSTRVTMQEHLAAEGGTVGAKCPKIQPKCRIPRYIQESFTCRTATTWD